MISGCLTPMGPLLMDLSIPKHFRGTIIFVNLIIYIFENVGKFTHHCFDILGINKLENWKMKHLTFESWTFWEMNIWEVRIEVSRFIFFET